MSCLSTPSNSNNADICRFEFTSLVTVTFGKQAKQLHIHQDVLCASSSVLKAACNGEWKEATSRKISLLDVDHDIFPVYVNWLYTSKLDLHESFSNNLSIDEREAIARETFRAILRCYLLGEFLNDRRFRNAATDEMVEASDALYHYPDFNDVGDLIPRLPQNSTMLRMLVDFEAPYLDPESLRSRPAVYTRLIAEACLRDEYTTVKERSPENREEKCFYHEHVDESDKCE